MNNSWKNLLPESCDWCPLNCRVNRAQGNSGLCGADDKLLVARNALHYWEEPPISGIIGGPKRDQGPGSGTIFFSNCNMKCVYCQNYEISGSNKKVKGIEVSLDELINMMFDLENQGAMNINFVTGTHYRSHIISAVRNAKINGLKLPIVWNSSGYESIATVYALNETVDVWLPDFKYADDELAKKYSHNNIVNYVDNCLGGIEAMLSLQPKVKFDNFNDNLRMTNGVIVRHLLLPGNLYNSKAVLNLLFNNFENDIKYSIMNQYTPVIETDCEIASQYPELLNRVSSDEYEELLDYADNLGIKDYYWQDGNASAEIYIPDWYK